MYGMVNEAMREMVCSQAGLETWIDICKELAIKPDGFDALCPYDDSITYKVVNLASLRLGISVQDILRNFGEHWITYTAEHGYGEIMHLFGNDMRTCLSNLNRMHAHMGALMPQLSPPRFDLERTSETSATLHYFSHREGLGPMVQGLLEGLAKKYGENISIIHLSKGARSDHDEFDITFR